MAFPAPPSRRRPPRRIADHRPVVRWSVSAVGTQRCCISPAASAVHLTALQKPGIILHGGMAERLKAAVLKTARRPESLLGGSNPPPSAWSSSMEGCRSGLTEPPAKRWGVRKAPLEGSNPSPSAWPLEAARRCAASVF